MSILKRCIKNALQGIGLKPESQDAQPHSFDHTFQRLRLLQHLGFQPQVVCDVGASNGSWSRKCLKIFPEASFFCIDPLVENRPALERLCSDHRAHYWMGCLGARKDRKTMNVAGGGSSLLPGHWGNAYGTQRAVPVETLDSLVGSGVCPPPDLIKLDVQGFELEVLAGARETLEHVQAVVMEISLYPFQSGMPIMHEAVAHLASHSLVVSDILSIKSRPLDKTAGQLDVLFIKADHQLRADNRWDRSSVY